MMHTSPRSRYGKFVNALYYVNMTVQALFSFAFPIGALGALAYFLTARGWVDEWIYVPCILAGVFAGFYGMIRFVLTVAAQVRALEREQAEKRRPSVRRDVQGDSYGTEQ